MKLWQRSIVVFVLLTGVLAAGPAAAQSNLLTNPGFEDGFHVQGGASEVSAPDGWTAWWIQGANEQTNQGYLVRPEYKGEDGNEYGFQRVHSGRYSQKLFSIFSTHNAGLFQSVSVPADATLQFSAWVQTWSSGGDDPNQTVEPGVYQLSIGIDPAGGTNPNASSVVWSGPTLANNTWVQLSVTAEAQEDRVTVFIRGAPQYRVKHNDSYWDDLSLVEVSAAPAATATPISAPQPTMEAAAATLPTANAETYIVQPGDTLLQIALRFGATVQALVDLNNLQNPDFVWYGQRLLIQGEGREAEPSQEQPAETYAVQAGDGLGEIALRHNTTVATLAALNNIVNPDLLFVGQALTVPGSASTTSTSEPIIHIVQPGEILSTIAARYGVSLWAIAEANNLTNVNFIWYGQQLVIPAE